MITLNPNEIERLIAYCEHETLEATAEHLGIGVQTLKNHLSRTYAKLGVHKAHAAVYQLGLHSWPAVNVDVPKPNHPWKPEDALVASTTTSTAAPPVIITTSRRK